MGEGVSYQAARARVADRLVRSLLATARRAAGGRQIFMTSYPADLSPRWGWDRPPNQAITEILEPDRDRFERARSDIAPHLDFLAEIPVHADEASVHWENGFWSALDAGFQCACLINRTPKRYVEVGSGFSTMFARRTIDAHGLPTVITSIDPAPRASIDGLCDQVIRRRLQDVGSEPFTSLEAGDMVLFDGSHEAYMAADSVVMLLEILPDLPSGVLVGIDDVFLPWDYPASWRKRFYAEQYLLASFLLGGGNRTTVVLPAFYLTRADNDNHAFDRRVPRLGSFGKSFWFELS